MTPKRTTIRYYRYRVLVGLLLVGLIAACAAMPSATETPASTTAPRSRALTEFTTPDFAGSGNCAICHTALTDADGKDISIDTHWRSSMMANASTDPLWQAKVSTEVVRASHLQAVIEETCARCHMPMAYTEAVAQTTSTAISGEGFINPEHTLHNAAMDGVSCTLCHQIQPGNLGTEESFSGHFEIDTSSDPPNRVAFGQFDDPVGRVMESFIGFKPVGSPHVDDAALCATCHTLFTPYLDSEGNIAGMFPEQTPYLEWRHSDYSDAARTTPCQSCHMPETADPALIANRPRHGQLPEREPFHQHHFVGGNVTMLKILKANARALGVTATDTQLQATIERATQQLEEATATLTVAGVQVSGDTLAIDLKIEMRAGHKFPSGFPTRRAWLHVTVKDASGELVFESGAPQADGSIAGNNADADPQAYEPHYDVITSEDQVQIYESMMQNTDGEVTYTLLRAASYIKDNRILPRGFDKNTADAVIAPDTRAMKDENFVGGSDQITYQIDVAGHTGPFEITVELLYQSLSYQSIQDIRRTATPSVTEFVSYYNGVSETPGVDKAPTVVATVQTTIK